LAGQRVGAMKSGVSLVDRRTVFTRPMGRSVVLSAKVTYRPSGPVTAPNVTETDTFCRRYLNISYATVNDYFITKISRYFKDIGLFKQFC